MSTDVSTSRTPAGKVKRCGPPPAQEQCFTSKAERKTGRRPHVSSFGPTRSRTDAGCYRQLAAEWVVEARTWIVRLPNPSNMANQTGQPNGEKNQKDKPAQSTKRSETSESF